MFIIYFFFVVVVALVAAVANKSDTKSGISFCSSSDFDTLNHYGNMDKSEGRRELHSSINDSNALTSSLF